MKPEGKVIIRKTMSQADLDKQAEEADAAVDAIVPIVDDMPQTAPEPTPDAAVPTAPEVPPVPESTGELATLQAQIAEKDAKIEELTKRVRDEDGRRGGELSALRQQNEGLSNQVRELMAEVKQMRTPSTHETSTTPETEPLADYDDAVREGVKKLAKDAVKPLEEELARIRGESQQGKVAAFMKEVKDAVPDFDEINTNPAFIEWCKGNDPDRDDTRLDILDRCAGKYLAKPVIATFQRWKAEQTKATDKPILTPKGPTKPTKEDQVAVPTSGDQAAKKAPVGPTKADLRKLHDKIFRFATATQADREEYDRLVDLEQDGKLT